MRARRRKFFPDKTRTVGYPGLSRRRSSASASPTATSAWSYAHIAQQRYDPVYGARPLKRLLQRELETRIGRKLIGGEVAERARVVVDVKGGALDLRVEAPAAGV